MVWRDLETDIEYKCHRAIGYVKVVECLDKGRLIFETALVDLAEEAEGMTMYCDHPDYDPVIPADVQGERYDGYLRICHNVQDWTWRLIDEIKTKATGSRAVISDRLKGYVGFINMTWWDAGPHIHHNGIGIIDADMVCHFGESQA